MVDALLGSAEQKERWLPPMAQRRSAFARLSPSMVDSIA
jgi:hypothetical protein